MTPTRTGRVTAVVCALVASLAAGCTPKSAPPPMTALPDSLEIQVLGNEPFWGVTISAQGLIFREPEGIDGIAFPPATLTNEGNQRIFRSTRPDSQRLTLEVRITPGACSDGMSDERYSFSAEVKLGDRTLRGCARERAAGLLGIDHRWLLDGRFPLKLIQEALRAEIPATFRNGTFDSAGVAAIVFRIADGDLDGDGRRDAAFAASVHTGGTGTFVSVVPVLNRGGRPVQVGEVLLGDRAPVDSLYIENGQVVARYLEHAPGDPMCCPTIERLRRFRVLGGAVVEEPSLPQ